MKFIYSLLAAALFAAPICLSAQINGSLTFEGQNRTYIAYIPTSYTSGQPTPLVFVLHGFTQSAQAIMGYSGFNALADTAGFIAVYANGVGNAWNISTSFPGGSTANDVGFISALLDTMSANYTIDPLRVYTCGFSAGGFMSHRLACELNNRIAAAGSVAGTMTTGAFNQCAPVRAVPFMQIHGTADAIVSYNGGLGNQSAEQVLGLWTSRDSCAQPAVVTPLPDLVSEGSTVERQVWSPCTAGVRVEHLKILNGGHTWPGASGSSGLGNTNRDISATAELWRFFSDFTLPFTSAPADLDADTHALSVYPNPATETLRLQSLDPNLSIQSVRLLDAGGKLIRQNTFKQPQISLEWPIAPEIRPGIYLLEAQLTNGRTLRKKVVIQ
jgi:polyhydroxybutyrate depolymerase